MPRQKFSRQHRRPGYLLSLQLALGALLAGGLSGCVVVGASSRGGFFLWPGGLGLGLMILVLVLLLRRR